MAIKVKDAAASAKKFATRGAAAGKDYEAGVAGSGAAWEANTAAAAETYAAGVQDSISRGAFAKGVKASGGSHFEDKAAGVGARRFPEGIREAEGDYQEGVGPYLDTIKGLTLDPRRPKGDPANYRRSEQVGQALRAKKVGK